MNIINWLPFRRNNNCSESSGTSGCTSENSPTSLSISEFLLTLDDYDDDDPGTEDTAVGASQQENENRTVNTIKDNGTERNSPNSEENILCKLSCLTMNPSEDSQNAESSRNLPFARNTEFPDKDEKHSFLQKQTPSNALLSALKCNSSKNITNAQKTTQKVNHIKVRSNKSEPNVGMRPRDLALGQASDHSRKAPLNWDQFKVTVRPVPMVPLKDMDKSMNVSPSLSNEHVRNCDSSGSLRGTRGLKPFLNNHPHYVSPVTTPEEKYPASMEISLSQLNNHNGNMAEGRNYGHGQSAQNYGIPRTITSKDRYAPTGLSSTRYTSFDGPSPSGSSIGIHSNNGHKIQREVSSVHRVKPHRNSSSHNNYGVNQVYPKTHICQAVTTSSQVETNSVTVYSAQGVGTIRTMCKTQVHTTSEMTYSIQSGSASAVVYASRNEILSNILQTQIEDQNELSHMPAYGGSANCYSSPNDESHEVLFSSHTEDSSRKPFAMQNEYIAGASSNAQIHGGYPYTHTAQNVVSSGVPFSSNSERDSRKSYSPYSNHISRPLSTSQCYGSLGPSYSTQNEGFSPNQFPQQNSWIPENHATWNTVHSAATVPTAAQNYRTSEKISTYQNFNLEGRTLARNIEKVPTITPSYGHTGWNSGVVSSSGCIPGYSTYDVNDKDPTSLFSEKNCRPDKVAVNVKSEGTFSLKYYERKMRNNYYLQELVNNGPVSALPTDYQNTVPAIENTQAFQNNFQSQTETIDGSSQPLNKNTGPSYSLFAYNHEMEKQFNVLCTGQYASGECNTNWNRSSMKTDQHPTYKEIRNVEVNEETPELNFQYAAPKHKTGRRAFCPTKNEVNAEPVIKFGKRDILNLGQNLSGEPFCRTPNFTPEDKFRFTEKRNYNMWDSFSQEKPIVWLKCPFSGFMKPLYVDDILTGEIYDTFDVNLDYLTGSYFFTIPEDRLAELRNHAVLKELYSKLLHNPYMTSPNNSVGNQQFYY